MVPFPPINWGEVVSYPPHQPGLPPPPPLFGPRRNHLARVRTGRRGLQLARGAHRLGDLRRLTPHHALPLRLRHAAAGGGVRAHGARVGRGAGAAAAGWGGGDTDGGVGLTFK